MPLVSTTIIRITREVATNVKPTVEDTPEEAEFRAEVTKDIKQIRKDGMIVDIPFEFPELDA